MKKIQIISDNNNKSVKIRNIISRKLVKDVKLKYNIVIVIGGDGFMLHTLKKLYKLNKPFYGINSGNYGFLMNKFSSKNLIQNLSNSKVIKIHPLEMSVKTRTNNIKKSIAINEVSVLRQSRQTASVKILNGKKKYNKKFNI